MFTTYLAAAQYSPAINKAHKLRPAISPAFKQPKEPKTKAKW